MQLCSGAPGCVPRIVEIVFPRRSDLEAAWQIVQRYDDDDQDLSPVDCVSFTPLQHVGIEMALASNQPSGL